MTQTLVKLKKKEIQVMIIVISTLIHQNLMN